MNIKVCGITQLKQLQQVDGLNIDFAGLVFQKESPQYVVGKISKEELEATDFDVKKVGVFENTGYEEIKQIIEEYDLDVVQLNGDESPELCRRLSTEVEVIKAFSMGDVNSTIDEMVADYDDVCDYYLFDTAEKGPGGEKGEKVDWKVISKSKIEKPFFLGGDLSVDDIAKIKAFRHPDYFGIDVSSRFEKSPGIKDMAMLLRLKQGLKK